VALAEISDVPSLDDKMLMNYPPVIGCLTRQMSIFLIKSFDNRLLSDFTDSTKTGRKSELQYGDLAYDAVQAKICRRWFAESGFLQVPGLASRFGKMRGPHTT
jgi:hypothetical protein